MSRERTLQAKGTASAKVLKRRVPRFSEKEQGGWYGQSKEERGEEWGIKLEMR